MVPKKAAENMMAITTRELSTEQKGGYEKTFDED